MKSLPLAHDSHGNSHMEISMFFPSKQRAEVPWHGPNGQPDVGKLRCPSCALRPRPEHRGRNPPPTRWKRLTILLFMVCLMVLRCYEYGVKVYSMVYSMGIFNMVWSGCGVKLYIMLWVFYAILMALLVYLIVFMVNLRKICGNKENTIITNNNRIYKL